MGLSTQLTGYPPISNSIHYVINSSHLISSHGHIHRIGWLLTAYLPVLNLSLAALISSSTPVTLCCGHDAPSIAVVLAVH